MKNNYTKGKWRTGLENKFAVICDTPEGLHKTVAYTNYSSNSEECKTNAEHIVNCVNLHEEIMQKLDDWRFEIDGVLDMFLNGDCIADSNVDRLQKIQSEIKELQKKVIQ